MALVDEGFSAYAVRGERLSVMVDDHFPYIVLLCDDETSVATSERIIHMKGLQATIVFYLKVVWVNVILCT